MVRIRERRERNRKNIIVKRILIIFICLLFAFVLVGYFFGYNTVNKTVLVEAGGEISAADFGKYYKDRTEFTEDISWIDTTVPGTYTVSVKNTIFEHVCELIVVDTIAPVASGVTMDWYMEKELLPEILVGEVTDVTELTYVFLSEVKMNSYVTQDVTIKVTDAGNNSVTVISTIKLIPLVESIYIELGEELPDYTAFLLEDSIGITCVTNISGIDNNVPQSTQIEFKHDGISMYSTLVVQDTIAPTADPVDVMGYFTSEFEAIDFVANIIDGTEVTASFGTSIDMTSTEKQNITIILEDACGNTAEIISTVTLEADTEAPEIICIGGEISNVVGEAISYRSNVYATDNCDEEIEVTFDNSEVDIYTAGEYQLYCTAVDAAGNETAEAFTVVIYEQDSLEAEVDALADAVLAEIIDDTMTDYEKVEAIYWYCKYNISYVGYSDKSDYTIGAYEGLMYHSGDCFTYAATAKVLLTKAGITNMDIHKIPAATEHYWNLVDLGDGWVHFDSCARADGTIIFLWTTEEVLEYSNSHNLTHNIDEEEFWMLFE